mmetsp:Transcript_22019/g.41252  ORF Transcript_22019/g.41252 Transcript_22019/m.41252 type:complete len:444 (-) Transcript_22019:115-1446(-)
MTGNADADYRSLEAPVANLEGAKGLEDQRTKLGFWQVVFMVSNGMIGPVILVVPYSFFLVGVHAWTMYVFAFFMFWFTGHLLYKAQISQEGQLIPTFPEIGGALIGPKGRDVVGASITIELLGLCSAFVVIVGDNLVKVQPLNRFGVVLSKATWILIFAAGVTPSVLMQNYTLLAEMSKIGVLVCFSIPVLVIMMHLIYPVSTYMQPHEIAIEGSSFQWENLPLAMGIVSVAYTTHAVFPTVVAEMKNVKEFPKALEISFGVVTLFYLLAGAGFYIYGKATDPQITFNLPESMQFIVSYAIIITICLKFALMINPVVLFVEKTCKTNARLRSLLCIDTKLAADAAPIKSVRIALVATCVLAALLIPYIALIHSVVGVFWSIFVCVVLPCVLALQLPDWLPMQYAAIWGLLGLSTVMMFTGLYQNILQIIACYNGTNEYENMCN